MCNLDMDTTCAALLMVGYRESSTAAEVGVAMLQQGCESAAIIDLASLPTDKARLSWSDISESADRAVRDVGINVTEETVEWAAIRRRAFAVRDASTPPELFWAVRDVWFTYWEGVGRTPDLDSVMAELVQFDDEWEATALSERLSSERLEALDGLVERVIDLTTALVRSHA